MTSSDKALLVALELLRREMGQLPMSIVRAMAERGTLDVPGLTPSPSSATATGSKGSAPTIDPDTGLFASGPRPSPKPAPVKGYAEAGALKVAGLVNAILGHVAQLRSLQVGKWAGRARRLARSEPARRVRRDFRLLRKGLGFAANNRATRGAGRLAGGAARGAGRLARAGVGKAAGGMEMLARPLLMIVGMLGPMAMFAAVLQSATSGFGLVTTSVRLLAATLGPILLPFLFLLASGLAAASDMIWDDLQPALQDWFTLVLTQGVPVIEGFLKAVQKVIEFVKGTVETIDDHLDEGSTNSNWATDAVDWVSGLFGGDTLAGSREGIAKNAEGSAEWQEMERRIRAVKGLPPAPKFGEAPAPAAYDGGDYGGGGPAAGGGVLVSTIGAAVAAARGAAGGPPAKPSVGERLRGSMQEVLAEMQFQSGTKASMGGFAQSARAAQLATLNESPFEKKMQQRMQEVIGALGAVVNNTAPRAEPKY